jgi:hypothetical protein
MQHVEFDHLVVAAASLDQGRHWCETTLGVSPQPGGQHPLMGTHNLLLQLSSTDRPQCYLEIIAVDPAAPAPARRRWFGLDDPALQARLDATGPELVGYVARSAMVDMHRWGLINGRYQPGPILKASRDTPHGLLQWQIVVADDGLPLAGGAVPTLIQWQGPHPADQLPPSGVTLGSLAVRGISDQTAQVLRLRGLTRRQDSGPALNVMLDTPNGVVALSTLQPRP